MELRSEALERVESGERREECERESARASCLLALLLFEMGFEIRRKTFAYLGQGKGCLEHTSTALLQLLQHLSMKWCGWIRRLEQKRATCDEWHNMSVVWHHNRPAFVEVEGCVDTRYRRCQLCFFVLLFGISYEEDTSECIRTQKTASTIVRNDVWSFCGNREGWRVCYILMHNMRAIKTLFTISYSTFYGRQCTIF